MYCNVLQRTATHCNTLQHTATHRNTPQHTATHCNTLHHTATLCNTLQRTADTLLSSSQQRDIVELNTIVHVTMHFCGHVGLFWQTNWALLQTKGALLQTKRTLLWTHYCRVPSNKTWWSLTPLYMSQGSFVDM